MATALRRLDDPAAGTAIIATPMSDDTAVLPTRDESRTQVLPVAHAPAPPTPVTHLPVRWALPTAAALAIVGVVIATAIVVALIVGDKGVAPANPRSTPSVLVPPPVQRALDRLTKAVEG